VLSDIEKRAAVSRLYCVGIASVLISDNLGKDIRSVVLLGPDEPAFWPHFRTEPECSDGRPDPLDRWSRRVIGRLACDIGAKAVFPFGGPPYWPFISWAQRSGRAWQSPVGMLVHEKAGLFFSVRGAISVTEVLEPTVGVSPCLTCSGQPCRTSCPAAALGDQGYVVPACHAFLDGADGADCREGGCRVRRACPVGQARRLPDQSAFHMKAFHRHDPSPDPDPPREI
jgi:epoxyqueuosine reductase